MSTVDQPDQDYRCHDHTEARVRLVAQIVRSLLTDERFATLEDVTTAVRSKCMRLRIGWNDRLITAAYRLIVSGGPLEIHAGRPPTIPPTVVELDALCLSREQAAKALRALGVDA